MAAKKGLELSDAHARDIGELGQPQLVMKVRVDILGDSLE
jgi:hypothetical protein